MAKLKEKTKVIGGLREKIEPAVFIDRGERGMVR